MKRVRIDEMNHEGKIGNILYIVVWHRVQKIKKLWRYVDNQSQACVQSRFVEALANAIAVGSFGPPTTNSESIVFDSV